MSSMDRGLITAQPSWQHLHRHAATVSALRESSPREARATAAVSRRSSSHAEGVPAQHGGLLFQFPSSSHSSSASRGHSSAGSPPSEPRRAAFGIPVQPGGLLFTAAMEGPLRGTTASPLDSPRLPTPASLLGSPAGPLHGSNWSGSLYRSGLSSSTSTTTKSSSSGVHSSRPAHDGLVYRLLGSPHHPQSAAGGAEGGSHFYFSEPIEDTSSMGAPLLPTDTRQVAEEEQCPGRWQAVSTCLTEVRSRPAALKLRLEMYDV